MDGLELNQIRMKLTDDPIVLGALESKKVLKRDPRNQAAGPYVSIMFNSMELRFHKGEVKTLNKSVADAIHRNGWVNIGDDLTGELVSYFDVVEELNIGDSIRTARPKFACPVCNIDQKDANNLGYHLSKAHSNDESNEVVEAEE